MKKGIITFFALAIALPLFTQSDYEIREAEASLSRGSQNSFTVVIPYATTSLGEDILKKLMREYKGRPKLDKKSNEWFADDAKLETISDNTVDVYTKFRENLAEHFTEVTFWFDLGGAFLSTASHPDKVVFAHQLLNRYGDMVTEVLIEEELKMQEKRLKELDNDLGKLNKENEGYHKEIDEAQAIIDQMKKDIEINLNAQGVKQSEIEKQRATIDQVKERLSRYQIKT
ncbi:MAG: hypothetical protein HKN76_20400 [Saprospiraceae bacterium]|nr:hypothetical protein [Saprospiraceae bacterium]